MSITDQRNEMVNGALPYRDTRLRAVTLFGSLSRLKVLLASVSIWFVTFGFGMLVADYAGAADSENIQQRWQASPHADRESESFRHWDEDGEIPVNCAGCHSMTGFLDYTGEDGTPALSVDTAVPPGTVIGCSTCHHDAVDKLESIPFPSGFSVSDGGSSTPCLVCHQGRLSTVQVDEKLDKLEADTISPELSFLNVHYRAAAASLYGNEAKGGYEYPGKTYAGKFTHPEPLNSCSGCHDAHALTVSADQCSSCHEGVTDDTLASIRLGSPDIDGDGDINAGVAAELATLHSLLGDGIQQYASNVSGKAVVYSDSNYPYYFNDSDGDGTSSAEEAVYPNRYQSWTPRLLRAAYNYQFVAKDPGVWAHNPRYGAQLLIDSIEDLAAKVTLDLPDFSRP